jgi:hypothetical protein
MPKSDANLNNETSMFQTKFRRSSRLGVFDIRIFDLRLGRIMKFPKHRR